MKKTIIAAIALVAMAGCNKTLIEAPVNDADFGYINLGVTADTEMIVTKAATSDALDTYRVCLYSVAEDSKTPYWAGKTIGTTVVSDNGFISLSDAKENEDLWKVPAGTYSIFVENEVESDLYSAKGGVYVNGEAPVTVYAGLPTDATLNCVPKNSKVSFIYNDDFKTVFNTDDLTVSVSESARTVSLIPSYVSSEKTVDDTKSDFDAAYFGAGKSLTWKMSLMTTATNATAKEYTSSFNTTSGKWTIVTFSTGSTNGTINVTITVEGEIVDTETITFSLDPTNQNVTTGNQN